jgi:hypothetical protein
MQIFVKHVFDIKFSNDTTILSLIFNCTATLVFCMHKMHDTTNTLNVSSLIITQYMHYELLPPSQFTGFTRISRLPI